MADLQPDIDEVLQTEEHSHNEETPVGVLVTGVVRTQALPQKTGSTKTVTGITTTPVRLLTADHRRSRCVIICAGGSMRFAFNQASKESPATMALWPAGVPYEHLGDDELWVAADTVAISVAVATGRWATGEDGGS